MNLRQRRGTVGDRPLETVGRGRPSTTDRLGGGITHDLDLVTQRHDGRATVHEPALLMPGARLTRVVALIIS